MGLGNLCFCLFGFFMEEGVGFEGARCSSVVRVFAHRAMGCWIDPSWGGPIELFLIWIDPSWGGPIELFLV